MKDKSIGAKVVIKELLVDINPKDKFKCLKKVHGTIVENIGYQQYYYTSDGIYTSKNKQIIKDDVFNTFAIKLDNDLVDIAGNNIVVMREFDLLFNKIQWVPKPITEKRYLEALKIVKRYEEQNKK